MINSYRFTSIALLALMAIGAPQAALSKDCEVGDHQFVVEFANSWGMSEASLIGSDLEVVGLLKPSTSAPISMAAEDEYTFHISNAGLSSLVEDPQASTYAFGSAKFTIYKQSPGNVSRPPAANPPNATVPSTFTDGEVILEGTIDGLVIATQENTSGIGPAEVGTVRGGINFSGGSQFGELSTLTWKWNATVGSDFFGSVPQGYDWKWGGSMLSDCAPAAGATPTSVNLPLAASSAATFQIGPVPAPVGREMNLRLELAEKSRVEVALYGASGRHLETVFEGTLGQGVSTRTWTPRDVSAGIYFLRASVEDASYTRKLVIVD